LSGKVRSCGGKLGKNTPVTSIISTAKEFRKLFQVERYEHRCRKEFEIRLVLKTMVSAVRLQQVRRSDGFAHIQSREQWPFRHA
jgi:hypothetical protein